MPLPAHSAKPSAKHICLDRRCAVGPAPRVSLVAPVDREDHRRGSGTSRPGGSLRGVLVAPEVQVRITARLRAP